MPEQKTRQQQILDIKIEAFDAIVKEYITINGYCEDDAHQAMETIIETAITKMNELIEPKR